MPIRSDLPPLPPEKAPTYFNLDAAQGLFWGNLLGNLASLGTALVFAPAAPFVYFGSVAVGTALGAAHGKARMTHEATHGRPVEQPSFFNKGMWAGWLGGAVAFLLLPEIGVAATLGVIATSLTVGSVWYKEKMENDVRQGEALKATMLTGRGHSPYVNSVGQQEYQQLEQRMKRSEQPQFSENLAQSDGQSIQQAR
jgi:hypothetical protein